MSFLVILHDEILLFNITYFCKQTAIPRCLSQMTDFALDLFLPGPPMLLSYGIFHIKWFSSNFIYNIWFQYLCILYSCSTTGARDPVTSALQIITGKRIRLDIAQIVTWKTSQISKHEPRVRYTASFAG